MGWLIGVEVVLMGLEDDLIGFQRKLKKTVPSLPHLLHFVPSLFFGVQETNFRVFGGYWSVDPCPYYFDYYIQVEHLIEQGQ